MWNRSNYTNDCCFKQEVVQSQVLEAKVFHSPYGTGIAIVTGSSRFTLATNIEDLKLRRLPEVPGKQFSANVSFNLRRQEDLSLTCL